MSFSLAYPLLSPLQSFPREAGSTLRAAILMAFLSLSLAANSLKIFSVREFNVKAYVGGMIPPVIVCILFIMKLGYRSRYASTAAEEEALEEERIAFETNNINIFT